MKNKKNLQDKINQAKVAASAGVWQKIEVGLDADQRTYRIRRNSIIGWAAAVLIIVLAYQAGKHEVKQPDYQPQTLQLTDQAGEIFLPRNIYPLQSNSIAEYHKGGRLVPNTQTLWKNPLVPRTVDF